MINEEALVRRARQGDRDAFGELVNRYMKRSYRAALSLVGSPDDALDLSQEAFARAFRARRKLDPERPFYAWLYQILRRLCFNFVRDRQTRTHKLREASAWMVESRRAEAAQGHPDRAMEMDEARHRLAAAMEGLPEREREALVLKEFEGLRYREIASLLGIPIGTVMSRLYAARRRLADTLENA